MHKFLQTLIIIVISVFICESVLARDLVFTSPPREKPEVGLNLYGPLAAAMGKVLGEKVVYKHPGNWLRYQRNMRNGDYDIIFDGPHFASWRIAHVSHTALVKLPGTLDFFLAIRKSERNINRYTDLIGKKICGILPPNLSTLSVLASFDNPVRQPVIIGIRGGMGVVYKKFNKGSCTAMILRNVFFFKKLSKNQQAELKIILKIKPLPNQLITVSDRISEKNRKKLAKSIINGEASGAANLIVKRYARKAKSFKATSNKEYLDSRYLLEGVIFGW